MAGSTPASATASAGPATALAALRRRNVSPWAEAWRRFRRHKLAVAGLVVLAVMVLMVAFGPLVWKLSINDIDFTSRLKTPTLAHPFGTDDLGQDIFARMLYGGRISLAVGLAAMLMAMLVGVTIGAIAGISRGAVDAALMWLTDLFLSLPQLPLLLILIYLFREALKSVVRPRGRRLHPDRHGDRRLSLDAGGAAGAGAVLLAAREGVRRGGARARRLGAAPGGAPHPAQLARAGDRRRHHRRGRGDHRRVDAVVPRPRLPARHPDLGPHPLRQQGVPRHRAALGALSRAPRSSSRCCASTSSATACATRSIRARFSDGAARDQGAEDPLQDRRGLAARRRRRRPLDRPRRDRLRGRRIGLRQDGDGDDGAQAPADAARPHRRRPGAVAGARPGAGRQRRDAKDPRQGDRDRLPGADDLAEPGLQHRRADRRIVAPARRPGPQGRARAGGRDAGAGAHPDAAASASTTTRTSSRAACASA